MSIWFIIAWILLGIIALGIVGYTMLSNMAERKIGKDWYKKLMEDEPEKTEDGEVVKNEVDQVLDEFTEDATEYRNTLPKWNLIGWIVFTIFVWPVATPYLLHHINVYGEEIESLIRSYHKY